VLKKYIDQVKVAHLLRKGVYTYEHVDSFDKFQEVDLLPKEELFSSLIGEGISDEDYAHAQEVYRVFECQKFEEYHDLYLQSDVLLLADVFENFRNLCLEFYELDPAHFNTSPGLSWQAC
jgi:hypothetical protein